MAQSGNKGADIPAYVPDCTRHYAQACVDPFSDVPGVCLPSTLLPIATRKFTTRATVQWATGTSGAGFCAFTPGSTWTSAAYGYWATQSTSTVEMNDPITIGNVPNVLVGSFMSPMSAPPSAATNVRLVAFGTRTRSTTPGMNRGGLLFGDQSLQRDDLQDPTYVPGGLGRSLASMISDTAAARTEYGTGDTVHAYNASGPTLPEHLELLSSNDESLNNAWFFVGAASSAPQSFVTEAIAYWEAVERLNPAGLTPSHSEPSMSGAVVAAMNSTIAANPGGEQHQSRGFLARLKSVMHAGFRAVAPVVKAAAPMAGSLLGAITGGPAGALIGRMAAGAATRAVSLALQGRPGKGPALAIKPRPRR